jgi:phenylpropionate dioxygenase-like ring-hydroxylating dioxygenase large terminal subunit
MLQEVASNADHVTISLTRRIGNELDQRHTGGTARGIVKESSGPQFAMFFTVTPVAERTSIAWTYVAKDYENIPDEETRQFEDMIIWQDVAIVESQRPELMTLDLQAELHLRSERIAIAYRKWLRQLGLTFRDNMKYDSVIKVAFPFRAIKNQEGK